MSTRKAIDLAKLPTAAPKNLDKEEIKDRTAELCEEIGELHNLLMADGKHAVLLVLQGMDSSGKDGLTRSLLRNCSPTGVGFHAFKAPSEMELKHDFLWRAHQHVPYKGQLVVFNRSYYEDVLVQRVNKWIGEDQVQRRMASINDFERLLLEDNNTTVVKFYLHIGKEKQEEKLLERISNPKKNWKHNDGDWEERKKWDEYMAAYNDVFKASDMPWQMIPADHEWYRDYVAAEQFLAVLKTLPLKYPTLSAEIKKKYLG